MDRKEMEAFAATVTPERLRELVLRLEPQQPQVSRGTVPLYVLLEELCQALPGIKVTEQARLDVLLRQSIMAAVEKIEGMTFVEGDT
jgi:hypothetical protein